MPGWLTELQGLVTVLDGDNNPMARRRTIKFSSDFDVDTETVETDAGPQQVITVSGGTGESRLRHIIVTNTGLDEDRSYPGATCVVSGGSNTIYTMTLPIPDGSDVILVGANTVRNATQKLSVETYAIVGDELQIVAFKTGTVLSGSSEAHFVFMVT